jgi:hypothetical protein
MAAYRALEVRAVDPMTLKQLGEWRLEAMRRDAQCRNALCDVHAGIARTPGDRRRIGAADVVRRTIGGLLVKAGLTVLGDQHV